jgi:hypothetical protein
VFDFEHQTMQDVIAPAGAWAKQPDGIYAAGERGLRAKLSYSKLGAEYVQQDEGFEPLYKYISPVAVIAKATNRVVAVTCVAFTNLPKTQNQTPLSEQIAAKALTDFENYIVEGKEGGMNELAERLLYFLNLATTSTNNELRTELAKVLGVIPQNDDMVIAPQGEQTTAAKKTLLEFIGLFKAVAGAIDTKSILGELELADNATLAQVQAKVASLKLDHPDQAEFEQLSAKVKELETENATLKTSGSKDALEQLVASNKAKLPPAKETWFRALVAKHGIDHGREVLKNLEEVKPRKQAEGTEPTFVPTTTGETKTVSFGGKDVPVDPDSLVIKAKVEAIQRENPEKWGDYAIATKEYERRVAGGK